LERSGNDWVAYCCNMTNLRVRGLSVEEVLAKLGSRAGMEVEAEEIGSATGAKRDLALVRGCSELVGRAMRIEDVHGLWAVRWRSSPDSYATGETLRKAILRAIESWVKEEAAG